MSKINLLKIIEELRKFDTQLEAQAIAVFFYVGTYDSHNGISMQKIAEELDISQSSVSRNVYKFKNPIPFCICQASVTQVQVNCNFIFLYPI